MDGKQRAIKDGKQEAIKDARAAPKSENKTKQPAAAVHFVRKEVGAIGEDLVSDLKQIEGTFMQQHQHGINKIDIDDDTSSLFEKTSQALLKSVMIYAIADIRTLIRTHKDEIQGDPFLVNDFMELPITDTRAMKVVQDNFHLLQKYMKKCDLEMYLSGIRRYGNEVQKQVVSELDPKRDNHHPNKRASIYQSLQCRDPVELRVFDDTNSTKELVYAIAVNR